MPRLNLLGRTLLTLAALLTLITACALTAPSAWATDFDGTYRATVDNTATTLTLQRRGTAVTGTYAEGQLALELSGTITAGQLTARIREPTSGLDIARFTARADGDALDASIDARHPLTGAAKSAHAVFRRTTTASSADAASTVPGSLDRELIGTLVNEKQINSGGANFASFSTVMTMALAADGRVQQWSRSVGGGGNWSYDSGTGDLQYAGRWSVQDGVLYVQLDGSSGFKPVSRYRFSGAYLVTENDAGRLIWQRR